MADGNRAAVHVHNRRVPTHVFVHSAGLGGKGLIRLDQIEIANFPACLIQRLAAGIDRADAHDRRVKPGGGIGRDPRQHLQAALFSLFVGHQQNRRRAVIDAAGIACGDRAVLGEGRAQLLHRLQRRAMPDVFVSIDHDIAFAGFHGETDDLILELARLLRGLGLVLAFQRKLILHVARNLPLVGNVFGSLAHVIAVEGIPQTVTDHRIDEIEVTHLLPGAQMRDVGRQRHVFLTTGDDDPGIAQRHMLRAQGNRPQTRATDLVQTPGAGFFRQTGADGGLTGRVLALTCGQHLTQNGFFHFGLVDPGTGHDAFDHGSTQIMGRSARERAVEAANGGPPRCNDYHIGHELSPPFAQRRDAALQHG